MKNRVCHVCSAHSIEDNRVFHRACVTLASAGYEVHLIAQGKDEKVTTRDGVFLYPLPEPRSRFSRIMRRGHVADMAQSINPDVYHVHEPELLGPVVSRAHSRPVIWDVHESYLEVLMNRDWVPMMFRPLARLIWDLREKLLLRKCMAVVAATERVATRYRSTGIRVEVIANYPQLSRFEGLQDIRKTSDGRTGVFVGNLMENRGLNEVVRAVKILSGKGLDITLRIAGPENDYACRLLQLAASLGISDRVLHLGVVSNAEVAELLAKSSFGIATSLPYGNNLHAWPVKMFEYMAAGLPVIYSDLPVHREIAGNSQIGVAVDSTSPKSIADGIEFLVSNPERAKEMGAKGRSVIERRLNWESESRKLLRLYEEILLKSS